MTDLRERLEELIAAQIRIWNAGNSLRREARNIKRRFAPMQPRYSFVLFPDASAKWRWHLRASNGRLIAASGESFASRASAKRAALNVSRRAAIALVTIK